MMYICASSLLFLICLLPVANCHIAQFRSINVRNDKPLDLSTQPADAPNDVDIQELLGKDGTIVVDTDSHGPRVLPYTKPGGAIGIGPSPGASLFMVSNYGIWVCPIPKKTLDLMVSKAANLKSKNPRFPSVKDEEYSELFWGEKGCYDKMQDQIMTWQIEGCGSGPELKVPLAFFTSRWGKDKKPDPLHAPFFARAKKQVAFALKDYGGPDFIPILGQQHTTDKPDRGTVIRYLDLNDKGEKLVEVFAWSHNPVSKRGGNKKVKAKKNRPILPLTLSEPYKNTADPNFPLWQAVAVKDLNKLKPESQLVFGQGSKPNFVGVEDWKGISLGPAPGPGTTLDPADCEAD